MSTRRERIEAWLAGNELTPVEEAELVLLLEAERPPPVARPESGGMSRGT